MYLIYYNIFWYLHPHKECILFWTASNQHLRLQNLTKLCGKNAVFRKPSLCAHWGSKHWRWLQLHAFCCSWTSPAPTWKTRSKWEENCQDMSRIVKIRLWWFLWWSSTIFFCTEEKYYHEPWTPWTSFLLVLAKTNRFRSIWFGHGKLRVFWLSTIFASASTLSLGLSRRAWQRPVKWTCWSSAVEQLCTWAWLWAQTIEVTSGC